MGVTYYSPSGVEPVFNSMDLFGPCIIAEEAWRLDAHWAQSSGSLVNLMSRATSSRGSNSSRAERSWTVEGDQGQVMIRCGRELSEKLTI